MYRVAEEVVRTKAAEEGPAQGLVRKVHVSWTVGGERRQLSEPEEAWEEAGEEHEHGTATRGDTWACDTTVSMASSVGRMASGVGWDGLD